jgi:hypothetical protein
MQKYKEELTSFRQCEAEWRQGGGRIKLGEIWVLHGEFNHRQGTVLLRYTVRTPIISLGFLADTADISQERMGENSPLVKAILVQSRPLARSRYNFDPLTLRS